MNSYTFLIVTVLLIGSSMQKSSVTTKKAEASIKFPLSFDTLFSGLQKSGYNVKDEVKRIFGKYDLNKNNMFEQDEWKKVNVADVKKALDCERLDFEFDCAASGSRNFWRRMYCKRHWKRGYAVERPFGLYDDQRLSEPEYQFHIRHADASRPDHF